MKKGNKAAAYCSELCDEDHERQVVGIYRFCQVLDAAIQAFLDSKSLKAILHDKVYQKTREEGSTMQPYLQKLILTNYEHRVRSIRGIAYEKMFLRRNCRRPRNFSKPMTRSCIS